MLFRKRNKMKDQIETLTCKIKEMEREIAFLEYQYALLKKICVVKDHRMIPEGSVLPLLTLEDNGYVFRDIVQNPFGTKYMIYFKKDERD
jgi:hypothetical protein